jgi:hypothetical protein
MAYRDFVVDISPFPGVLPAMLDPIAAFRPTAEDVLAELR